MLLLWLLVLTGRSAGVTYLLRFTGLEGLLEDFYSSGWIHVLPLGAHHKGEEVPQLLHERQVPLLLPAEKQQSSGLNLGRSSKPDGGASGGSAVSFLC